MNCAKFDKRVNLFLDGRLLPEEESELKEHLAECKRCQEKLSLLKLVEEGVKRIQAKEPPPEYWDTFSSRVRENIIIRKEKSLAVKLKQAFEIILNFSPWKIKIAAGLVSILLVFIIGKLYVDYRGKEIVPSSSVVRPMKEQKLPAPVSEKKEALLPEETKETKSALNKAKGVKEPGISDHLERKAIPEEASAEKEALQKEAQIPPPAKIEEKKGVPSKVVSQAEPPPPPALESQTPVQAEKPEGIVSPLPEVKPTGAGAEKNVEEARKLGMSAQAEKVQKAEGVPQKGEAEKSISKDITASVRTSLVPYSAMDHYVVNEKTLPKIKETDTLMQMDEIRSIIQTWKTQVQENPTDSLSQQGYLQVATGYYLLSRLTQDTTTISEGSKFIEEHLDQIKDPRIKNQLSERLEKIKALGKK